METQLVRFIDYDDAVRQLIKLRDGDRLWRVYPVEVEAVFEQVLGVVRLSGGSEYRLFVASLNVGMKFKVYFGNERDMPERVAYYGRKLGRDAQPLAEALFVDLVVSGWGFIT